MGNTHFCLDYHMKQEWASQELIDHNPLWYVPSDDENPVSLLGEWVAAHPMMLKIKKQRGK